MVNRWFLGVDVGASATKAVLLDDTGTVCQRTCRNSGADFRAVAQSCLQGVVAGAKIAPQEIERIVATGYGRNSVEYATSRMTEITCHARGCYESFPKAITIVDIGGQDNKVIVVTADGDRRNFKMNRKCAAGTGAFLEEIAGRLDTPLAGLDELADRATGDVELSSFCTVFAKTELLRLIARGTPVPDIARAAFRSVVQRILEMDPLSGQVVMTGGVVAHHRIVVDLVSEAIGRAVLVPDHAQYTGAYGAALLAREA